MIGVSTRRGFSTDKTSLKPARVFALIEKGFTVVVLLLYSGAVLSLWQKESGLAEGQSPPAIQIIFVTINFGILLLALFRWKRLAYVAMRDKFLVLLVGMTLISVLWSSAPGTTLDRSFSLIVVTLFGMYLAERYRLKEQMWLLAWAAGIALVLSLVVSLALPQYGVQIEPMAEGWRGVFGHKNVLGVEAALGASLFFLLAGANDRYRWILWGAFGLAVGLLLLSGSKTALAVLLVLLLLLPVYRSLKFRYTLMIPSLIVSMWLIGGLVVSLVGNAEYLLVALGREPTLTGRTEIWPAVFDMVQQRPWLGYGYSSFWLGWEGESAHVWLRTGSSVGPNVAHAHNGFLDMWLDLGLAGLAVFALGFVQALWRAVFWSRVAPATEGLWPLLYLTFLFMYNLTESALWNENGIYFWLLYVAVILSLPFKRTRYTWRPQPRNVEGDNGLR